MAIIICDIDGTLADIAHRLPHIKNGNKNWKAFNEGVHLDGPVPAIIELVHELYHNDNGMLLVSGRGEEVRKPTTAWLEQHQIPYDRLYMRPAGDYRKDTEIKREILDQIHKDYPGEPIRFVIDDRTSVVKMWREAGLTCLQCAEWNEDDAMALPVSKGFLTLMVGPSGAGKSTWLDKHIPTHSKAAIISSDALRAELCEGNFQDQSRNVQVFAALHALAKGRIENGLPAVIDATNIRRADRLSLIKHTHADKVRYIVIDRPLEQKYETAGWRCSKKLGFDLIAKHHSTFHSQLKDILNGDGLPFVEVIDLRNLDPKI